MVFLMRILFLSICAGYGFFSGFSFVSELTGAYSLGGVLLGVAIGLCTIFLDLYFKRVSVRNVLAILVGIIAGLGLSWLLVKTLSLTPLSQTIISNAGCFSALILAYLGAVIIFRGQDEFTMMIPFVKLDSKTPGEQAIILDTSVIIDGRIADICETVFLSGKVVVPRFVLKELQLIADSADDLKRNRGRRGLDVLNRIKNNPNVEVKINEMDFPDHPTVDAKLVLLAQAVGGVRRLVRTGVNNPVDRAFWRELDGSYVAGFKAYFEPLLGP